MSNPSISSGRNGGVDTAWWCKDRDLNVASIRIRGELVMRGLAARGHAVGWYQPQHQLAPPRCIVVSKRLDAATVQALQHAKNQGSRIVVDLCDNIFTPKQQNERSYRQVENLVAMVAMADAIVAASEPLAAIIRERCPDAAVPQVIGDLADDLSIVPAPLLARPLYRWKLAHERRLLRRAAARGVARLLWFGNNGGKRGQSGYPDLRRLLPALERLNQSLPVQLSVISNHRGKYRDMVRGCAMPTRYIEWDPWTFDGLLREHEVVLIPSQLNAFSICKTDNRVVSALRGGVAVAADRLPSYTAFEGAISLGDIEAGIRSYLQDPALRAADVARGRRLVDASTAPGPLLDRWEQALALPRR